MAIGRGKSKKGILLTLAVVVLVVLMVAELVAYVYLNINYQTLDALGSGAAGSYRIVGALNSSTAAFLHASLYSALRALSSYEGSGKGLNINNTAYALGSLMTNGMIYGTNEVALMGGATLNNYTNSIIQQAKLQGFSLVLTNASLQIYQTGPASLNATYYALAVLNSSSGSFTYPITASSGVPLNGSADLYSVENGDNYNIKFGGSYPSAMLVGNAYASSGSRSPFQFIYGTIISVNSLSSCAGIPSRFENVNFILAIPNDQVGSCGFGGVVTYAPPAGGYSVPYLVYSGSSNIMSYLYNGTSLLLNGAGLSLLNVSALQAAMHNGYYFGSTFAPAYLDWAQGSVNKRSQNGLFSFNLYNREVLISTQNANVYVQVPNAAALRLSTLTIAGWINIRGAPLNYWNWLVAKSGAWGVGACGNSLVVCYDDWSTGVEHDSNTLLSRNTWYFMVATIGSGTETVYINGANVFSGTLAIQGQGNGIEIGGSGGILSLNGSVADVQIFNSILSQQQIYQLYLNGVDGLLAPTNSPVGWWPLDGNPNDYSGNGYNGVVTPGNIISFRYISGYSGDPIYGGSFYGGNLTNIVEGILNCANMNQCSNQSLQRLYLGPSALSASRNSALSSAASLGLANAVIPNVAAFSGGYINQSSGYGWMNNGAQPFSISIWIDPSKGNGVVVDELGQPLPNIGWHDSWLELANGNLYMRIWALGCVNLGSVPLNKWTGITMTYDGGTYRGYVNGVFAGSGSGARSVPGGTGGMYYVLGSADSTNCGSGAAFSGSMADYQFYNTALGQAQISQLYLNDSVMGVNAIDRWPLSYGYNGLMNQTADTANAPNAGLLSNIHGTCPNANVISGLCGVGLSQP